MPLLTLPELHGFHARALANAAAARRDYAKGGTRMNPPELALLSARLMLDAARNVRNVIERRNVK